MKQAKRTGKLLLIGASQRYLDRLCLQLNQKAQQEGKLSASLSEFPAKRAAVRAGLAAAAAQLERLQANLREARKGVEGTLSEAYGGRPVHITGSAVFY